MKRADLKGQRFGKLVAHEYIKGKWHCVCDCGNECDVLAANLVRGHTQSCGCLRGTGIINRKFGKLTVIEKLDDDNYLCVCECGNKRIADYKTLTNNFTIMCRKCAIEQHSAAIRDKVFDDGTQPSKIKLDKAPGKANKSGVTGVNWDKSRGKWQATIRFKGKKYNLGRFADIEDAISARKKAEKEIFLPYIESKTDTDKEKSD